MPQRNIFCHPNEFLSVPDVYRSQCIPRSVESASESLQIFAQLSPKKQLMDLLEPKITQKNRNIVNKAEEILINDANFWNPHFSTM